MIEKLRAVYEKRLLTTLIEDGLYINPHSKRLLLDASALYIEMSKYSRAAEHCLTLIADDPRNHEALYNLGLCRLWQNNYEESIALFDSSRSNGGTIENLYYIGVVNQLQKNYPEAIAWYQKRFAASNGKEDQGAISSRARIAALRDKILADSLKETGWTPPDLFEQATARKALRKDR
jgi:tetratricopeptide (TPR) repeat protein